MEKFNKDTGHAILAAAQPPRVSNTLAKSLFDKGPLGTFSAKIDLARALSLIDRQTRHDLILPGPTREGGGLGNRSQCIAPFCRSDWGSSARIGV
jgi:hypothetical protein